MASLLTINQFLDTTRHHLQTHLKDAKDKQLVLVTGNDAADLDSVLSALVYAYLSSASGQPYIFAPIVKVPASDLVLRPEIDFVLGRAGVTTDKLICMDGINLPELKARTPSTSVVLVDHNRLTPPFDDSWSDRVQAVLDHHVDEGLYKNAVPRDIRMVGSCMSLVLLHFAPFLKTKPDILATIAPLARAPILTDTIGLRHEYGKTTDTDIEAIGLLGSALGDDTEEYDAIEKIKSQCSHLDSRDLLRKDYKEFVVGPYRVGTSSVPWCFEQWAARDGLDAIADAAGEYMQERKLDLEIILTSYDHAQDTPDGQYQRELGIFVSNPVLLDVKETLEKDRTLDLTLTGGKAGSPVGFYKQGNVKMSRKQVWPLINSLLQSKGRGSL